MNEKETELCKRWFELEKKAVGLTDEELKAEFRTLARRTSAPPTDPDELFDTTAWLAIVLKESERRTGKGKPAN